MSEPHSGLALDPDSLADHALRLWRIARDRIEGRRFDLFLKTATRRRAARAGAAVPVSISDTLESGLALRVVRPGGTAASLAACSGLSVESLRWVLAAVAKDGGDATAEMPDSGSVSESHRTDLDPDRRLPSAEELDGWVANRDDLGWVECGTTHEVIVGDQGWTAVRRRHRTWAMTDSKRDRGTLLAARGFRPPAPYTWTGSRAGNGSTLIFAPNAAAVVVGALLRGIQEGELPLEARVGGGLCVADEPAHPEGLAGGAFDDAGFDATRTLLADGRRVVSGLPKVGALRRGSYRDAPSTLTSTPVVFSEAPITTDSSFGVVRSCRILPLSREEWVLSFAAHTPHERASVVRVTAGALAEGCLGSVGRAVVCADGVISPGLVFRGIEVVQ